MSDARLTLDDPWAWLARGFRDMRQAPSVSLAYGAVIAGFGLILALILWRGGALYLILPLSGGFMLMAPVLAVGLYEASRRIEAGLPVTFPDLIAAARRAGSQLGLMAGLLLGLHLVWIWVALLIFMLFFGGATPSPDMLLDDVFFQPKSIPFLLVGTLAGFVIAVIVFAMTAISIPMLIDPERDVGVVNAVAISYRIVFAQWEAMWLWAGLIVIFSMAGFACLMIGLAVTLPLIGHATWHAYRASVPLI